MRRGTTPTLHIKVKGVEVEKLTSIYLTIKQGTKELTIREDDVYIDAEDNSLEAPLSQQETLDFSDGYVNVQLRAMIDDCAVASDIKTVPMEHILREGEIE